MTFDNCTTTVEYWDCNCATEYIKPQRMKYCHHCGAFRDFCPDSRVMEVAKIFGHCLHNETRGKHCRGCKQTWGTEEAVKEASKEAWTVYEQ
jgi:hypothetical protein